MSAKKNESQDLMTDEMLADCFDVSGSSFGPNPNAPPEPLLELEMDISDAHDVVLEACETLIRLRLRNNQ